MYRFISKHRLNKCLSVVETAYNEDGVLTGRKLTDLCQNSKNLHALHILDADGYIRCTYIDGSSIPLAVFFENKGYLYFISRQEKLISYILGLLSGIAVSVLSAALIKILL